MKTPLLTLAAVACTFVATANAQKAAPPTKKFPSNGLGLAAKQQPNSTLFPPPNDGCATPTVIAGGGPFAWNNTTATLDGGAETCGSPTPDIWYRWTAPSTNTMVLDLCSGTTGVDSMVAVYNGAGCPAAGTAIACNDDFCAFVSHTTFAATSGNQYMIRIGGYFGAVGSGTFTVGVAAPPPANNACATPTLIAGAGPFAWNSISATTDGGTESCGTPNSDIWYTWTAPSTNTFVVDFCTGTFGVDTVVAVYIGAGCPIAGSAIACDDDFCSFAGSSHTSFAATGGNPYTIRVGGYAAAQGSGTFTIDLPPPPPVNDDCTAPTSISGGGPFSFNTTSASTGSQGQTNGNCNFFGTLGIESDVWYSWTAPSSGTGNITVCGQSSVDTKMAIYQGTGCPAGTAIACNDDSCGTFQSTVCFPVTNGQAYTIQLGTFPGASGGPGTFGVDISAPLPPCQYDDGSSENLLGWTAGGEMVWLQRFGSSGGGSTTVSNIQVAWGSPTGAGVTPGNGTAVKVALWDDPNDDGDPSDAVLLQLVNTTVANVNTDTFNTIPIGPFTVNGAFFVGAGESHAAGQFVAVMDQSSCIISGAAWFFGNNNANPVDYSNVLNNAQVPATFDSVVGGACNLLLRAGCDVSPLSAFCLPGQGGVRTCPCANPPAGSGLGCNNFGAGAVGGATLTGSGSAIVASDTLVLTSTGENNTSFTLITQGTTQIAAGLAFGAAVRCVGGNLKRIYSGNAGAAANGDALGTFHRPGPVDPTSVHQASINKGYTIVPPITLYYFAYYRDPLAAGPCGVTGSTFNATQAGSVLWQ